MFRRIHRFHGPTALNYVYRQGQTVRQGALSLRYVRNSRQTGYRCAVVVSKKVSKSAVVRNRIRRRIYAALRLEIAHVHEPYDLVVSAFSAELATTPATDLTTQLQTMLRRAGVLTDRPKDTHDIIEAKET